jgi:hypothetical protein
MATVMQWDAEWVYAASVWVSWVGPLTIYEGLLMYEGLGNRGRQRLAPVAAGREPDGPAAAAATS